MLQCLALFTIYNLGGRYGRHFPWAVGGREGRQSPSPGQQHGMPGHMANHSLIPLVHLDIPRQLNVVTGFVHDALSTRGAADQPVGVVRDELLDR